MIIHVIIVYEHFLFWTTSSLATIGIQLYVDSRGVQRPLLLICHSGRPWSPDQKCSDSSTDFVV